MRMNIIGTEQDSLGTVVTVLSTQHIGNTPIVPVLMRNYADLIEQGFSNNHIGFANRSKAVYIEIDNKIVGHIVYDIMADDPLKTAWIQLSHVDPDFRQRGLYNIMHKYFEQVITQNGTKRIASYVHVKNEARIASCKSVGMEQKYFRMEKYL